MSVICCSRFRKTNASASLLVVDFELGHIAVCLFAGDAALAEDCCWGLLAHPPARGQTYAVLDERLLGVGVDHV